MTEEWRWVVGSDTHEVSNLGRVRATRFGQKRFDAPTLIRPYYSSSYLQTHVVVGGRNVPRYVHRLVLDAFDGGAPPGCIACHFPDADAINCRFSNLRWDTRSGNGLDSRALNAGAEATAARLAALQVLHPHLRAQAEHHRINTRYYLRPRNALKFFTANGAVA